MNAPLHPMAFDHFHCVDTDTAQQTIKESKFIHSIDLGRGFTAHHGTRYGAPIVMIECEGQKADELSCIWFDESIGSGA